MKKSTKVKLETIWIINNTQVGNAELKRGCMLEAGRIYEIDKKYPSIERNSTGSPVDLKISEADAAKLILENQAVNAVKNKSGKWVAADAFGNIVDDGPKIIIKKAGSAKKVDPDPDPPQPAN